MLQITRPTTKPKAKAYNRAYAPSELTSPREFVKVSTKMPIPPMTPPTTSEIRRRVFETKLSAIIASHPRLLKRFMTSLALRMYLQIVDKEKVSLTSL
jgi:hypothetical protein